jgi:peptidylprolyl isomerase
MFGRDMRSLSLLVLVLGLSACHRSSDGGDKAATGSQGPSAGAGSAAGSGALRNQIAPPVPVQSPPADAIKTASGLVYKKLVTNDAGAAIKRNDTVMVNYTGWRQASGETFFTNRNRGQAMRLNLAQTAPGFAEGLQLLRKGETAMLWVPAAIGYKAPPANGKPEALVYQFEVVDVLPAPEVPEDVSEPPAKATALPSGMKFVLLRPGTSKDKPRQFDSATFTYTVWDREGKMLDTTVSREKPSTEPPYKLSPALGEMLMAMSPGSRARFWVDASRTTIAGKTTTEAKGLVCYDVELHSIAKPPHDAPPTPPDVAKPPADAKQTAKGVFYRMIRPGPGKDPQHPEPKDTVKVKYTGWTTDGRMFDSSELRGEPSTFNLRSVVAGWTDGIPLMTVGDRMRFWIPEAMAYKGKAGKPAGMLVFDVELVEIVAPTSH